MRFLLALVTLIALSPACFSSASELSAPGDDFDPTDPGSVPNDECVIADDCVLTGPTCCDCPTFALPIDDPKALACEAVGCDNDTSICATNVEPACDTGRCVMACAPLSCLECPNGYLTEPNGCLSCTCAPPPSTMPKCVEDSDCARVRNDCCGCGNGGEDTAVATADAVRFDQGLNCPSTPQCPGQTNLEEATCGSDFEPRCVRDACVLLDAEMPSNACGRADLLECPAGQTCQINVDPAAGQYGLGICL